MSDSPVESPGSQSKAGPGDASKAKSATELLPCPFCGGEARFCGAFVKCSGCLAEILGEHPPRNMSDNKWLPEFQKSSAAAWNRRAPKAEIIADCPSVEVIPSNDASPSNDALSTCRQLGHEWVKCGDYWRCFRCGDCEPVVKPPKYPVATCAAHPTTGQLDLEADAPGKGRGLSDHGETNVQDLRGPSGDGS